MPSHKNTTYKPLPLSNPYQEGQDRAFSDLLMEAVKDKNFWRNSFYANVFLFIIALILFFAAVRMQETVPVLINVMPSGEPQYLGEVRQGGDMQVPEAAVHYQIRIFVSNLRSVSTDHQVLYNNIDDCFIMVTSRYAPVMRQSLMDNSPFDLYGKIRRTVEIESVLHITGRSYQVNWSETTLDSSSTPKRARYRAVATVSLIKPTDATIRRNPLGIYIENFEMTEL